MADGHFFQLRARKTKFSVKREDLSQNHSLKSQLDGPQSQIPESPAEWKGDMQQGNTLQAGLVSLGKGKHQPSSSSRSCDAAFPLVVTHAR